MSERRGVYNISYAHDLGGQVQAAGLPAQPPGLQLSVATGKTRAAWHSKQEDEMDNMTAQDYIGWAQANADRDHLERATAYAAIAQAMIAQQQTQALQRIAAALEKLAAKGEMAHRDDSNDQTALDISH